MNYSTLNQVVVSKVVFLLIFFMFLFQNCEISNKEPKSSLEIDNDGYLEIVENLTKLEMGNFQIDTIFYSENSIKIIEGYTLLDNYDVETKHLWSYSLLENKILCFDSIDSLTIDLIKVGDNFKIDFSRLDFCFFIGKKSDLTYRIFNTINYSSKIAIVNDISIYSENENIIKAEYYLEMNYNIDSALKYSKLVYSDKKDINIYHYQNVIQDLILESTNSLDSVIIFFKNDFLINEKVESIEKVTFLYAPKYQKSIQNWSKKSYWDLVKQSADAGSNYFCYFLGENINTTNDLKLDKKTANFYFEKACNNQYLLSCLKLIELNSKKQFYISKSELEDYITLFENDPEKLKDCHFSMYKIYKKNKPLKEIDLSIYHLKQACVNGHKEAFNILKEMDISCF